MEFLEEVGTLFYVVSPNKTSFETMEEVPDFHIQAIPYFIGLFFLEQCYMLTKGRTFRLNELVSNVSQGMFVELTKFITYSWEIVAYVYIYSNWKLVSLPWNSAWTWFFCLISIDFLYYWTHRATHEINFLWALHQVHHSSEDYNLAAAVRQPFILNLFLALCYLPLAVAVPPSIVFVHNQLNLVYQFWIHTEAIKSIGPLEYILNTASHHRVHHGRNRYCIDKNYAGFLIIWDRMFGTFEAEKEEVVYGLTHPINSFNPFYIQFHHMIHIWKTFWATNGLTNKLSVLLKGPGWAPGKPWHGHIEDIPDVKAPAQKYDPPVPMWCKLYTLVQGLPVLYIGLETLDAVKSHMLPQVVFYIDASYLVYTVTVFGFIYEGRWFAKWMELIRGVLYIAVEYYILPYTRIETLDPSYQQLIFILYRVSAVVSGIFLLLCLAQKGTVKTPVDKTK